MQVTFLGRSWYVPRVNVDKKAANVHLQFFISDGIVVWRTWVLWHGSWWMVIPCALWVGSFGACGKYSLVILFSPYSAACWITERVLIMSFGGEAAVAAIYTKLPEASRHANVGSFVISLGCNAVCTCMIGYVAW